MAQGAYSWLGDLLPIASVDDGTNEGVDTANLTDSYLQERERERDKL